MYTIVNRFVTIFLTICMSLKWKQADVKSVTEPDFSWKAIDSMASKIKTLVTCQKVRVHGILVNVSCCFSRIVLYLLMY